MFDGRKRDAAADAQLRDLLQAKREEQQERCSAPRLVEDRTDQPQAITKPSQGTTGNRTLAANEGLAQEELNRGLPKLGRGLAIVAASMFVVLLLTNRTPDTLSHSMAVQLPMQLYWTFCIYRLSTLIGRKFGTSPLINGWGVAILSLISYTCQPIFGGQFTTVWMDPFFWLWATSQYAFPLAAGRFLSCHQHAPATSSRSLPIFLSVGTSMLLIASSVQPELATNKLVFPILWLFAAFWPIRYVTLALRQEQSDSKQPAEQPFVFEQEELVVRYRALAEIERWIKDRMSGQNLKQGMRQLLLWVVGPAMVFVSILAILFLSSWTPGSSTAAAPSASEIHTNSTMISNLALGLLATVLGASLFYFAQPTHICFGPSGIRWLWRHWCWKKNGKHLNWQQVQQISVRKPPGETSTSASTLSFDGTGIKLKMNSIDSIEAKEAILVTIQKYGANIRRDASVVELLQPPADYSYTELWLQALSAPPKRERLKPLIAEAMVKNGTYRIKGSLGVGGQGQAYLALDTGRGTTVVLKEFILPVYVDVTVRRKALESFENEARILRQLDHRQIVRLLDYFIEDHRAYLVLEYIEGASLRQIVEKSGPLSEQHVLMLATQMGEMLRYLHGLKPPVVHRDFTPDNLILNTDGTLRLIDFNVAKQVESTTVGTVVGKHAYLPPEQFRGQPVPQSDIYAFGCTLHYLLTGGDPEPIATSEPRKLRVSLSERTNELVKRATALDLKSRYSNIEALLSELGTQAEA